MPEALPPLFYLAALIVALGLITAGKAYTDFLAWVIKKLVPSIPLVGNWVTGKLVGVLQQLSNKLGGYANGIGGQISRNWHYLATIVDRVGWAIFHNAVAIEKLYAYVTAVWPLKHAYLLAQKAWSAAHHLGGVTTSIVHRTTIVVKEAGKPGSTALGKATRTLINPLRRELTALERSTAHRLAALAAAVGALGAEVAGYPHAAAGGAVGSLRGIRTRLRHLERTTVGAGAAALVGAALATLGLSWIRCRNWRRAGKQVCQMDAGLLDALLLGTLVVAGPQSIVRFAEGMQAAEAEMVGVLERMVVELGDVARKA